MSQLTASKILTKMKNKNVIASISGLLILSIILFPEFRNMIWSNIFYLILLLCPLMHVFLHGKHGNHKENQTENMNDGSEAMVSKQDEINQSGELP